MFQYMRTLWSFLGLKKIERICRYQEHSARKKCHGKNIQSDNKHVVSVQMKPETTQVRTLLSTVQYHHSNRLLLTVVEKLLAQHLHMHGSDKVPALPPSFLYQLQPVARTPSFGTLQLETSQCLGYS